MRLGLAIAIFLFLAWPANACSHSDPNFLSVSSWTIQPIDDKTNRITLTLATSSEKPIRMIEAQLSFYDALGGYIDSMLIDRDISIARNKPYVQSGVWEFQFARLLNLKHDEVRIEICTRTVLYDDGSKQFFGARFKLTIIK